MGEERDARDEEKRREWSEHIMACGESGKRESVGPRFDPWMAHQFLIQ